jgi:predicted peroxiredoxin
MCGVSKRAKEHGMEVVVYFLGDGVFCTKKNQKGYIGENMKNALKNGAILRASKKDLNARAISDDQVEPGIEIISNFEEEFITDMMEKSDRVISW